MKKTCGDFEGKKKDGTPCGNPAGKRTDHLGEGKCFVHGGCSKGRPITSGKYARKTSKQLKGKIERHLDNPNPLNLLPELAFLRALIEYFQEQLDKMKGKKLAAGVNQSWIAITAIIDTIRKCADTVSKMQSRELLTMNELMYSISVLADVLREEITDEDTLNRIFTKYSKRLKVPELISRTTLLNE